MRNTGFTFRWFLQDIDGNLMDGKGLDTPYNRNMKYLDTELVRMVEFAQNIRLKNLSIDDILYHATKEKINQFSGLCFNSQLGPEEGTRVFEKLLSLAGDIEESVEDQDIRTGFIIYSKVLFCDKFRMKLTKFIVNLFTRETPRNIIKTMVSLFESKDIKDKEILRKIFLAVGSVFHLQYGKVLLAGWSMEALGRVVEAGWPYFTPYIDDVEMCLNRTSCTGLSRVIEGIG